MVVLCVVGVFSGRVYGNVILVCCNAIGKSILLMSRKLCISVGCSGRESWCEIGDGGIR